MEYLKTRLFFLIFSDLYLLTTFLYIQVELFEVSVCIGNCTSVSTPLNVSNNIIFEVVNSQLELSGATELNVWAGLTYFGRRTSRRVGHMFPPNFFLPAVFPPKFSSWQVILLGLDTPRHYFTLDNSLLLIIHPSLGFPKSQLPNILLWLYSPRHLYPRHIVYPESFPPRIKTSQQQILLAFNSPRT